MTGTPSPAQQQALAQILQIMAANGLDVDDIREAGRIGKQDTSAIEASPRAALGQLVLRVFYYLGGTLVFAGLGIYITTVWHDLHSFSRVLLTLGAGFVAYLLGILFARDKHLEKAATPAYILAFLLQPVGISVLLKEYFHGDDTALGAMMIFGPLAVQQFLTFLSQKRASLLLFSLLYIYGFLGAATVHYSFDQGIAALACGTFLFFTSIGMQQKQAYRELTPLFFPLGSSLMLAGLYYHVGKTIYDPLVLATSMGFLLHAVLSKSKTLYVVSCLYIAAYFLGGPGSWFGGNRYHRHYDELTALFAGTSLVLAGHWLDRSSFISASPVWLFTGAGFALGGVYSMVRDTSGEPLFAGAATLAIYSALALRSRSMLAASIISLVSFLAYYAQRHFAKSVGWPLLLILFGFIILLAGFAFARLSARIKEQSLSKQEGEQGVQRIDRT
jgi:hypothetical protein